MVHVKKTMKAHKGLKLAQVLKMAAKTYKKGMKGGADVEPHTEGAPRQEASVEQGPKIGGRSRKTRRGGRKSKKTRKGGVYGY
jgi:hypothetical protein